MTINQGLRRFVRGKCVLFAVFCLSSSVATLPQMAHAVDGVWNPAGFAGDGTGLWSDATKWTGGTIANGAGSLANFSTLDINVNSIVSLDSPRTIGRLHFADGTGGGSNTWTLDNSADPLNVLTLDNTGGSGGPRITVNNQTATISAILAGTNGVTLTGGTGTSASATLVLSGANTYSGVTTINSAAQTNNQQFTVLLQNDSALGTSSVFFDPGATNGARLTLDSGVTIANNITLNTVRSIAGNAAIRTNGDVTATYSGSITKNGLSSSGGEVGGPVGAATTNFLVLSGPIINNLASVAKNAGNVSNTGFQVRHGNVRMADTTGTSSTFRIENRNAILQVGATNGIATNAYVDIGGNVGNPGGPPAAVLDLNGFDQRLVGVSNYLNNGQAENITNSSTTTASTLTLAPANPTTNPNQARLVFTAGSNGIGGNANISDADPSFPLSIVVNGDAAGIQYLTTPNGSYRGTTTLTSGTLAISSLADAGSNSSIGASSVANPATDLVFNGGTLRYVNSSLNNANGTVALSNSTTPSTNRNFNINNGTSGTIDVEAAGTTLTWSGGSANTTGTLVKAGPGTLILSGTNAHTGGTSVNAGTLQVDGSLATGTVNVASTALLKGTGTFGGTINAASGSIIAPGASVGTLTTGGLTVNSGSFLDFEFGAGINDMITVSNAGGLQINGGNLHLYNEGTVTDFSTNGTYTLMNINGGFSGSLTNLTVANSVAGKFYTLSNSPATGIQLTIGSATTVDWDGSDSTSWSAGGNWIGGSSPNAVGTSVRFNGTNLTGGSNTTVSVDGGGKTASGVIFNSDLSNNSFTIAGPSTLTLNNGVAAAAINVNQGSHTISAPILSTNTLSVSFANAGELAVSGSISGAKPLSISGTGTMTLTGANAHSSTSIFAAAANSATLNVGTFGGSSTTGTLGTGDVTMSGGAVLNFNRNNAYNFGGGIVGSGVGAGSVNQLGTGTTTVTGAINNVTSVNVSAGTMVASSTINQTGGINATGSGSLTANGGISGAGALTVNTTGTVALNAANSYTGGTMISGGTVNLGAVGALPANSTLGVDGGTLNLNANNISLTAFQDTVAGGTITNNGAAASTSTITFTGPGGSDDIFAALRNGAGGGKVAVVTSITNAQSGNIFVLNFHSSGTYSGGTTVNSQSIQASANNAFGTGPITINENNSSTNSSQILLAPGVSIGNNITIAKGYPHPVNGVGNFGVIQQTAAGGDTTVTGTVTILSNNLNDGLFMGPAVGGADFLNVQGAVNASGTADTIVQIDGQVKYSGGGNYPNIVVNGRAQLASNNGLSQSAVIQVANTANGTLDLAGFNQTAAALVATSANVASVENSGAGPNTLTLKPSGANDFNGTVTGNINLLVGGSGTQTLSGLNNSYTGATMVTAGTLSIASAFLADAADVFVKTGGLFDLNFAGTDTVDSLFLAGVAATAGSVWGSALSGAPNVSPLLTGTGTLTVSTTGPALPGDYNSNGIVDAADYVRWRDNVGTSNVLPNDPTGGTIGQTQYDVWRINFGATPGSGSGFGQTSAVPEPGTCALCLLALCGVAAVSRRRTS